MNLIDLKNRNIGETGFMAMANNASVYTYSYVMPPQYDFAAMLKF
jgi:hypothetical protein